MPERSSIAARRLAAQRISSTAFARPQQVVAWLGAVQAQDYLGALWAVGLRTTGATQRDVEAAISVGRIVRTWPMRGTLHLVAAADARWMIQLLGSRIAMSGAATTRLRSFGIDGPVLSQARRALERTLGKGRPLDRPAVYRALDDAGIATDGQRGLHILWRLAQHGVVCFGSRKGKQQTFALLDEWIPASRELSREESLAELATRYFTSHSPATLKDFAWWSGLSVTDARAGYELVKHGFTEKTMDAIHFVLPNKIEPIKRPTSTFLLPAFDEFSVGYADRRAMIEPAKNVKVTALQLLNPIVVVNGRVAGTWRRVLTKNFASLEIKLITHLTAEQKKKIEKKAGDYGKFLNVKISTVRFIR